MFKRIDELIDIHNLKHEIKEKDDSIWYIINGFTGDQKIAAFIIYNNEVKEGRMFGSVTALNQWFELICSGDDKYCYLNEEIHG